MHATDLASMRNLLSQLRMLTNYCKSGSENVKRDMYRNLGIVMNDV